MNNEKIIVSQEAGVLTLVLNNPSKMNCMGFEMLRALDKALDEAKSNTKVKLVLIKGAGDRAFSTGANLKEFASLNSEEEIEWIEFGNEVFNKLEDLPKPTVAIINGYAMGGGVELALACDFRLATQTAVFANPELQHGWLPGWGGITRLRRLIGEAKAKEMVMLCRRYTAEQALNMGVVTKVLSIDNAQTEIDDILNHLLQLKSSAFNLAKTALMDENRTTRGADIQFDILAMQIAKE